jgi:hypothetical protein
MNNEVLINASNSGLEDILGSAVVLHWDAVACQSTAPIVRVEYHVGEDGAVQSLKLWSRAREYWSLVCDYTPQMTWSDGPHFSNGYHSRPLGRLLQSILLNQGMFRHDCRPNSSAAFDVGSPTPDETSSAVQRVNEAFQRPSSAA